MLKAMKPLKAAFLFMALMATTAASGDYPEAQISNGQIEAKIHLPDAQNGSYRGTRFDWAGDIYSLRYKGHEYFGRWYENHDPKVHDAITGPVEEFTSNGSSALGYDKAKPGETFIRIGVGVLRRPEDESAFRRFGTYEIVDPGKRTINKTAHAIDFTQEVNGPNGYSYVYRKTVSLVRGKPEMVLVHTLRNTGREPIETSVYDHNFFVIDNEVVGPGIVVDFPFDPKAVADLKGIAELKGRSLVYTRDLEKGESVQSEITGFSNSAKDYDFRIENRKSGAGVRIRGSHPIEKINFWCIRTVACPEPYIHMKIEPGDEATWQIIYDFYTR